MSKGLGEYASDFSGGLKVGKKFLSLQKEIESESFTTKCEKLCSFIDEYKHSTFQNALQQILGWCVATLAEDIYKGKIGSFTTKTSAIEYAGKKLAEPLKAS